MKKAITIVALAALTGCAGNPDKIGSSHVSTYKYEQYSCEELHNELETVQRKGDVIHRQLRKERNKDIAATTVGLVLFWPALFLTAGDEDVQEIEYARLKGEAEALGATISHKDCGTL